MDLTKTSSPNKTPDNTHLTKSLSFTNNTFQLQHCHHRQPPPQPAPPMVVSYKECLKNHAASIGGHALDGCGEFMPSPNATPFDPTSLKCAACGCHRNFHRRDSYDHHHHHQHQLIHQLPPPTSQSPTPSPTPSPSSGPSSPQHQQASPVPYSYYASAPHMLLALSTGYYQQQQQQQLFDDNPMSVVKRESNSTVKKRSRTKFTQEQKEKMWSFAEKLGWTMQRSDARLVQQCCSEAGVCREVFKVWMHNHKKRESKNSGVNSNVNGNTFDNTIDYKSNIDGCNEGGHNLNVDESADGSYSSS